MFLPSLLCEWPLGGPHAFLGMKRGRWVHEPYKTSHHIHKLRRTTDSSYYYYFFKEAALAMTCQGWLQSLSI